MPSIVDRESLSDKLSPQECRILRFIALNGEGLGVNFPYLLRFYAESEGIEPDLLLSDRRLYMRLYMRLRRFLSRLENQGFIEFQKVDGLVWIKPTSAMVDLICAVNSKIQTGVKPNGGGKTAFSVRVFGHWARVEASKLLLSRKELSFEDWEELDGLLSDYVEDVGKRVIILARRDVFGEREFKFLRYRHRFLRRELKRKLRLYDRVWALASAKYSEGIFLTLTMDPKTYRNLYEASKRISKALNRFMSFLAKRLGFRPPYLAVFEPMDSGNPHIHLVVWGVRRIEDHYSLTRILVRQGFGMIHWEYGIKRNGSSWTWRNRRYKPRGAKGDVIGYLKKYLKKVFYGCSKPSEPKLEYSESLHRWIKRPQPSLADFKLAFYFASNKRFFTFSRCFNSPKSRYRSSGWVFVGSWNWLDVPDWILETANVRLEASPEGWRVIPLAQVYVPVLLPPI